MRAAVRDRYGPPEVVRVVEVDRAAVRDRLPARHATRVPYRRVNHGTERSATVTAIRLLTWPCHALPA
jgi:hypothetical protein